MGDTGSHRSPGGPSAALGAAPAPAAPSTGSVTIGSPAAPGGQPALLSARERGGARVVAHEHGTGSRRVARFRISGEEPCTVALRCSGGVLDVEIDGRPALDPPCDGVRTIASVHADPGWETVAVGVLEGSPDWEIVIAAV